MINALGEHEGRGILLLWPQAPAGQASTLHEPVHETRETQSTERTSDRAIGSLALVFGSSLSGRLSRVHVPTSYAPSISITPCIAHSTLGRSS